MGAAVMLILTAPIVFIALWLLKEQINYLLSGKLFNDRWYRIYFNGYWRMRQPIGIWYFASTVINIFAYSYIIILKWLCNSNNKKAHAILSVFTVAISLIAISIITTPFYWTCIYIYNMGLTILRIAAFIYGLSWYIIIAAIVFIVLRKSKISAPLI